MPPKMLLSTIDRIKLDGGVTKHLKLSVDVSTTFMDAIQEDANGPMSVAGTFPWSSVTTPRRGADILSGRHLLTLDGPLLGTVKVALVDLVNNALLLGMLCQEPPQQSEAPLEQRIFNTEVLTLLGKQER